MRQWNSPSPFVRWGGGQCIFITGWRWTHLWNSACTNIFKPMPNRSQIHIAVGVHTCDTKYLLIFCLFMLFVHSPHKSKGFNGSKLCPQGSTPGHNMENEIKEDNSVPDGFFVHLWASVLYVWRAGVFSFCLFHLNVRNLNGSNTHSMRLSAVSDGYNNKPHRENHK